MALLPSGGSNVVGSRKMSMSSENRWIRFQPFDRLVPPLKITLRLDDFGEGGIHGSGMVPAWRHPGQKNLCPDAASLHQCSVRHDETAQVSTEASLRFDGVLDQARNDSITSATLRRGLRERGLAAAASSWNFCSASFLFSLPSTRRIFYAAQGHHPPADVLAEPNVIGPCHTKPPVVE